MPEHSDLLLYDSGEPFEGVPGYEELPVGSAEFGMVAGAPRIVAEGDVPPRMGCRLVEFPDRELVMDLTELLTLHEGEEVKNEPGSARIAFPWDLEVTEGAGAPFVGDLITEGMLLEHYIYGDLVLTSVVESPLDVVVLDEATAARELLTTGGRLHIATLEHGLVFPELLGLGPTGHPLLDRRFDWSTLTYDDSGWINSKRIVSVRGMQRNVPAGPFGPAGRSANGFPQGSGAYLLWAPSGTLSSAPIGDVYLRDGFEVVDGGRHVIYLLIDNQGEFLIDGVKLRDISPGEGYVRATKLDIVLEAGQHVLAVRGTNNAQDPPIPPLQSNPGGIAYAIYKTDDTGEPIGAPILRSYSAKIVPYPSQAPGMTPGRIMRQVLEECWARGELTHVTYSFTDDVDSGGNPWPEISTIATKCGTDVFTFLLELCNAYVDFWMAPGDYVLDLWVQGERGRPSGVALTRALGDALTGNLRNVRKVWG